jgi:RNA 3'-terminal phosphate cyclase-like protein
MDIFDCGLEGSVTYFIEPIFILGLFSKDSLELTLKGITNDNIDVTIDCIRNGMVPFL